MANITWAGPAPVTPGDEERERRCIIPREHTGDVELLDAYSRAVTSVVDTVSPAVVSLAVRQRTPSGDERPRGSGSGVLIAPDGYLLTNSHVVQGASSLEVTLADGESRPARLVGDDPSTDLALVRVVGDGFPHATISEQPLRVGQLVIAIGSPLGFHSSVSTGVVSSPARALRGRDGRLIENVIQHTAPLNPGNSGGPLVDSRGAVVGINTAIIAMAQGIGFAVSSGTVRWVVPQLFARGRVRRAWIGIAGADVPVARSVARYHGLPLERAARVAGVEESGPAGRAGILPGDRIVAIDGLPVGGVDDLHRFLSEWPVGKPVTLTVLRGREKRDLDIVPADVPRG
ncbi:MAG: S1C family serine protease [Candidatus Eiseniibacteriota bacterium]